MQRLKISREGIVLIKSFEGFRPRALQREDGGWIIGYGHTLSAREGASVSEADAELLLHYDLIPVARAVSEGVATPVNQHQFDALASFAFSVGVDRFAGSDVLQRLNAGAAGEAADAMVGWPEPVLPQAALRRRAAERALFVADPASAVTLSDLLSAPLPPPPVPAAPAQEPAVTPEPVSPVADAMSEARAAALASLLGETPTQAPVQVPAFPGIAPTSEPVHPEAAPEAPTLVDAASGSVAESDDAVPPDAPVAFTAAVAMQRYTPYNAAIIGALPDAQSPAPAATEDPVVAGEPAAAPAASGFPPLAEPALVLTPLVEADVQPAPRPAWEAEQRPAPDFGQTPLFEEDADLHQSLGPVLRHEAMAEPPPRFDWGETGAFLIMGAVGLVSFGMSMAAFRLASQQSAGSDQTAMIGWVLAVIGVSCVGVSSINLYRRWGRTDED